MIKHGFLAFAIAISALSPTQASLPPVYREKATHDTDDVVPTEQNYTPVNFVSLPSRLNGSSPPSVFATPQGISPVMGPILETTPDSNLRLQASEASEQGCNTIYLPYIAGRVNVANAANNAPRLELSTQCVLVGQGGLAPIEIGVAAAVSVTTEFGLSVSGLPSSTQASFAQPNVSRSKKSSILLGVGLDAPSGTYVLKLRGQAGSTILENTLILIVAAKSVPSGVLGISKTSPSANEEGVAVTRETVIEFSAPLDPKTVTDAAIYAQFGGQKLPARLHLSDDKQRVTMFYSATLPASARVRVSINGDVLSSLNGDKLDVDGDGVRWLTKQIWQRDFLMEHFIDEPKMGR